METKNLLEIRKMKRKKMRFTRTDSNIKTKFKSWRKPRGLHNKMRLSKRGKGLCPNTGYGIDKRIKNLSNHGYKSTIINNLNDLNNLNKEQAIIIGSKIGTRKKVKILNKIKENGLMVLGIKDVNAFLKSVSDNLERRSKQRKSKKTKKAERKEKKEEKEVKSSAVKTETKKVVKENEPKK